MVRARNVVIAIVFLCITEAVGYYFGFKQGSLVIGTLASQNTVSKALGTMNSSVMALERDDLAYSQDLHQRALDEALFDLGAYASAVSYWRCTDRDQAVILGVKGYLQKHPNMSGLPPQPILDQALNFCRGAKKS